MTLHPSTFLRRALIADACLTGVTMLLMIGAAGVLAPLLGLDPAFLRATGLILLPFTAFLVLLLRRDRLAPATVWIVIAANALWAIDSIVLLFTGWVDPTLFGQAFIASQAVVVAIFAEAQYVGLRRSSPRAA